jgi:hypothetical protein
MERNEEAKNIVTYPVPDEDKKAEGVKVDVYLNGYLIKTAYNVGRTTEQFLADIQRIKNPKVEETEICIKITVGSKVREIICVGYLRNLLVTAEEG